MTHTAPPHPSLEIYFTEHAQSTNEDDLGMRRLTEEGRRQAARLRKKLSDLTFHLALTSPTLQARQTASILLKEQKTACAVMPELFLDRRDQRDLLLETMMRSAPPHTSMRTHLRHPAAFTLKHFTTRCNQAFAKAIALHSSHDQSPLKVLLISHPVITTALAMSHCGSKDAHTSCCSVVLGPCEGLMLRGRFRDAHRVEYFVHH
jgi:broad specificity phosphatase PhoE